MANTVIDVKAASEDGSLSLVLVQNIVQRQTEYRLIYYVVAQDNNQTFLQILATTGIPQVGSILYGMFVVKSNPKATATINHFLTGVVTQLWEVEVELSSQMHEQDGETPEVNWGGELDKEHLEFDLITGAKITTTAGEPIFTERQVFYQTVSIRRKETWPTNPQLPIRYVARVNLTPFYGYPQGTGMMLPIRYEEDTQDGTKIVWATYEIKFKLAFDFIGNLLPNSWQANLANIGYQYRLIKGGNPVINLDKTGHPIKTNLDIYGRKLVNRTNGGDFLKGLRIISNAGSGSLNLYRGVAPGDYGADPPSDADIGSTLIIDTSPGATGSFNVGTYTVVGIRTISGIPCWILGEDEDPGSNGSAGGNYTLVRTPTTVYYNRAYYAEFNALSLGPFS